MKPDDPRYPYAIEHYRPRHHLAPMLLVIAFGVALLVVTLW